MEGSSDDAERSKAAALSSFFFFCFLGPRCSLGQWKVIHTIGEFNVNLCLHEDLQKTFCAHYWKAHYYFGVINIYF